ncbi:methylenetetrahydrofolate reductase [NAD(P)H] [Clostridium sp. A1-XYC3]|uniref:Methylenetetrahydrofolate reductase n=1 Tax=Clostridium tanneri TaxID=3037988 RepID=A0ABU4JVF6_9CLOT|nr:methylenetetrahydrofolate reductase [NAD(P)H] [Clostridium sp. A1-XYC3]MDW8802092.1 methylenetetrahydrofolate reductase [NAD(P)H] [Clostridium sp. A1-XYC3]
MFIKDLFLHKKLTISFELFPPKQSVSLDGIYNTIAELKELNPDFISVTYGAGGSSKDRSIELASAVKNKFGIETVAHLTCITSTKREVKNTLDKLQENNIDNILALRGDIPKDFVLPENLEYNSSKDLICELAQRKGFCISAAAYPEGYMGSMDIDREIKSLRDKVDCGAEVLITQLFFNNNSFYDFKEKLYKYNINTPVIAGVMPAVDRDLINRISWISGASIPDRLKKLLDKYQYSPESLLEAGTVYASEQVSDLVASGVEGIHLYTMNKSEIVKKILKSVEEIRKSVNYKSVSSF